MMVIVALAVTHHMGCESGGADMNNLTASVTQTFSDNTSLRMEVGGYGYGVHSIITLHC
jgi:hypothetical protein